MATDMTITNANVNSGTAIVLQGATINYVWVNLTKNEPVQGKYDIQGSMFGGFQSPNFTITGFINVDDIPSNGLTQELLMDLAQEKSADTSLVVTMGTSATTLKGRPSAGYTVGGTYLGSIKIQIDGFSFVSGTDTSTEGHGWIYKIDCHETT